MTTFAGLIEQIGVHELARQLRIPADHVRTMRLRNSIPPTYWETLLVECRKRRLPIAYSTLFSLRQNRFRRKRG